MIRNPQQRAASRGVIPSPRRRAARVVALAAFAAICLLPHGLRLARASLFADDVARVEQLQILPPRVMLWQPFNEHLAPAFEAVTLAAWRLSGGRLAAAPWTFTLASLAPLPLILVALGMLVRRELGSPTAALAVVAVFALSTVPLECYWWFSASSFAWSLLFALVAWLGVLRGGVSGRLMAAGGALLAPSFSAIGLLAGPASAVRAIASGCRDEEGSSQGDVWTPADPNPRRRAWVDALAPAAGTAAYLVVYAWVLGGTPSAPGQTGRVEALARGLLDAAPCAGLGPPAGAGRGPRGRGVVAALGGRDPGGRRGGGGAGLVLEHEASGDGPGGSGADLRRVRPDLRRAGRDHRAGLVLAAGPAVPPVPAARPGVDPGGPGAAGAGEARPSAVGGQGGGAGDGAGVAVLAPTDRCGTAAGVDVSGTIANA